MRLAGRKTRVATLTNDNHVLGETIADFLCRGFLTRNGVKQKETVRLDVEASQMESAQSLLAMTHVAVGTRPKWAREHRVHTQYGPSCWVGSVFFSLSFTLFVHHFSPFVCLSLLFLVLSLAQCTHVHTCINREEAP